MTSVSKVEKVSPKMIANPKFLQIGSVIERGKSPMTVVIVVKKIGLVLKQAADWAAKIKPFPWETSLLI